METSFKSNLNIDNIKEPKEDNKEVDEPFHCEKYKKKAEFSNFLLKLYQILENDQYKDIVQWGENGKYFIVKNIHDFTEKILPKYFKHNNYSSFIRQLNMYDFHKKKSSQNEHIFQHKNFIRNQKDLIKTIKRKSKKEKENIPFPDNQKVYSKHTDLVPISNLNAFKNINNNINVKKSSLSIEDDLNLSNSVHSLFENNKRTNLPMDITYSNNFDNINNNMAINNDNLLKKENVNNNNNINIEKNLDGLNESDKKITKKNLEKLMNYLTGQIQLNVEMEKQLEIKIERLSKQNEDFMNQNKKMLEEIISKSEYNKKLETVICFILEMIMTKPKIKNNAELKNLFLSHEPNNKKKDDNNSIDNLSIVNFSNPKNSFFQKNDFSQSGDILEPFQNFLAKYLEKSKNQNNYDNPQIFKYNNNIYYDMKNNSNNTNILKRNLLCSGNENTKTDSNCLIQKKRKRSGSLDSILSELSNGSKVVYSNECNPNEDMEKIEEKKIDNENINKNNILENSSNTNNDSLCSWNKSKDVFDIDFNQEENKSDISDWNKDLLNNSQTSLNDLYSCNMNKVNDVFSDINTQN